MWFASAPALGCHTGMTHVDAGQAARLDIFSVNFDYNISPTFVANAGAENFKTGRRDLAYSNER